MNKRVRCDDDDTKTTVLFDEMKIKFMVVVLFLFDVILPYEITDKIILLCSWWFKIIFFFVTLKLSVKIFT